VPSYVSATALATIRKMEGFPAYSPAHWTDGDRIVLLSDTGDLNWIQLDGDRQGVLARDGDAQQATEPTFSHDGKSVVYVSTTQIVYGRAASGPTDLYVVPYGAGAGGPAKQLVGAAESDFTEYYPAYSPDDAFVAFTRIPGNGDPYGNAQAEVFVVPAAGGTALRLKANDAPACQTDLVSPGLTNDWSKWSPEVARANGKSYYWITFSSTRTGNPQLYVTGLVVDASGTPSTFPALYLWNQPAAEGNHTPSWDDFQIPPIVQ
jgi:Tol biopolymer transport system component